MSQTQEVSRRHPFDPALAGSDALRVAPSAVQADLTTKPQSGALLLIKDYISLTKPGVMALLLVSTICPMILASHGEFHIALIFWALVGGALVSGSASAINCIWDRDIDAIMARTMNRPVAAGRISPRAALIFSLVLGGLGLWSLYRYLNPFAALTALFGHFFYVFIYTMWLKRTTPQNIVIGGAAGAIPPIVGWVGVTGQIDATAILLFLVVFLWTPPHFWALALNKNTDYSRAGVPMLPVVAGEHATHIQMLIYALALIPVTVLLVFSNSSLGMWSLGAFLTLGVIFAYKTYQLKVLGDQTSQQDNAELRVSKAWDVFGFSLIYLALFFVVLVLDSTVV